MKLLISIEYRTRWGEQLVMRIGKRRIALQYADDKKYTENSKNSRFTEKY